MSNIDTLPFDPDAFMQQTVDGPLETERTFCPIGEFPLMIDDFDAKTAIQRQDFEYKKGPNAGQPGQMYTFDCPCVVQDERVKQELCQEKVIVYKRIILDIENGKLAFGKNKNIELGQLAAAVGQQTGSGWTIGHLRGAGPFMGRVEKKTGTRKDGSPFESREVGRVAPLRR